MDVAIVEHALQRKAALYEKICNEFVGVSAQEDTIKILDRWDGNRARAATQAATADGKAKRAGKKARKTKLLQRQALRVEAYTYVTSDERAAKAERGEQDAESGSGSDDETDSGTESHPWGEYL